MEDKGNLQGTMRTLDRTDGWNLHETFDPGVVSRDGWVILDESTRPIIADDDTRWGGWVAERGEGDRIDWYIMAYGHDYTAAVTDYMRASADVSPCRPSMPSATGGAATGNTPTTSWCGWSSRYRASPYRSTF